jgi:hypothetical protein
MKTVRIDMTLHDTKLERKLELTVVTRKYHLSMEHTILLTLHMLLQSELLNSI